MCSGQPEFSAGPREAISLSEAEVLNEGGGGGGGGGGVLPNIKPTRDGLSDICGNHC